MTTSEVAKVKDTVMSIPGMMDGVKITLNVSRKNILLLHSVVERGLISKDEGGSGFVGSLPADSVEEVRSIAKDILQKAGLMELSEKIKMLEKGK